MPFDSSRQDALNERHASDPQPGDYWHEMFCPVLVIAARFPIGVLVCDTPKDVGDNKWTWNLEKCRVMTVEELRRKLEYNSRKGFWANVAPRAHGWVAGFVADIQRSTDPYEQLAASITMSPSAASPAGP